MGRRTRPSLCFPLWKSARCVFDLGEGCHTSARLTLVFLPLCSQEFHLLFQRRKLLQNLTFHANRYHIGGVDRKKCVDKYQPWAVDGVGGGHLLAWFESGSFPCGGCIFSLDLCGPSPAALIPPAVQKHVNHGDKLGLMDKYLVS